MWGLLLALAVSGAQAATDSIGQKHDYADQIAHLHKQVRALQARSDLTDQVRKDAIADYNKAISALQSAQDDHKQAVHLRKQAAQAPQQVAKTRQRLAKLQKPVPVQHLADLSASELSTRIDKKQEQLADAQADLSDLRERLNRTAQRPESARKSLTDAREELRSLGSSESSQGNHENSVRLQAHNALISARRNALNAKIQRLQEQLSGQDDRERVLEARRTLAEARVARLNEALVRLQSVLTRQQKASAQSLQNASEDKINELRGTLEPISQVAQHNVELSRQLAQITRETQGLIRQQSNQREQVRNLDRRLNLVQRELEVGGGSVALGKELRKQRRSLAKPGLPFFGRGSPIDEQAIEAMELKRFQLQEKRSELDNSKAQAKHLAAQADVKLSHGQHQSLVNLLEQRRSIVDALIDAEGRYIDTGRNLKSLANQYQNTLSAFEQLLNKRLFRLPTFDPVGPDWLGRVIHNVPWLFAPYHWRQVWNDFISGIIARPIKLGIGAIVLLALLAIRRPLRRRLRQLGAPVGNVRRDTIWLTLRATLITVLLTLPGIFLFFLVAYGLRHGPDTTRFTSALAIAIFQLGLLWAFVEPFANLCRADGLAERHFQWPPNARYGLYRLMNWMLLALSVPVILFGLTEAFGDDAKRETLGRIGFMFGELMIAVFAWRLLHPVKGVLADVMVSDDGRPWRLGYFWLPCVAGIPLVLSGLAAMGYYYTALQLQTRFFYSGALLGASVVIYSLIVRWLTVAERRLALARALRRREEARQSRAARESGTGDNASENIDNREIDLVQINEQTRGLIKMVITLVIGTGLWLIWSSMLPVLQQLDYIDLWQYTTRVEGHSQTSQVTLGALLLAIMTVVVTALAGRNLPGFLEITVLRRFAMEPGSRYAVSTLFQYTIVLIGLLVAASLLGVRWSSVQWLIAALGLGLGFGLQSIFANFVSGLIILFGRSVRVGDTVTVGTLTGTVSRIRIRATTITDWDNKEVVIPNQTFITQTVINWTLRDDILRLVLSFAVALDADGDLVEQLINEAIEAESSVLSTPAPSVYMVGYGDSAMHYEARVYYRDLYNLLPLQHALYRRVQTAFARHGIRIVHPQHDLHLRSVDRSVGEVFGRDRDREGENEETASTQPRLPPAPEEGD
jgi:potassium efflux system protein